MKTNRFTVRSGHNSLTNRVTRDKCALVVLAGVETITRYSKLKSSCFWFLRFCGGSCGLSVAKQEPTFNFWKDFQTDLTLVALSRCTRQTDSPFTLFFFVRV